MEVRMHSDYSKIRKSGSLSATTENSFTKTHWRGNESQVVDYPNLIHEIKFWSLNSDQTENVAETFRCDSDRENNLLIDDH